MTTETSVGIIAVCQLIFAVVGIAAVLAIIWGVFALKKFANKKADEVMERLQPIVDQAKQVAEKANQTAENVSKKIDSIASKAENTAEEVTDKVKGVSEKVEQAVSPQVVAAAGAVSAAVKCFEIYRDVMALKHSGDGPEEPKKSEESSE